MQSAMFIGNLANAPVLSGDDENPVCKFTLISNEYAGHDENGKPRERQTFLQFTAFRGKAKTISTYANKGDQLIVQFRIKNNQYEKDGKAVYGYNFVVEDFTFGAPCKEKREAKAAA